MTDITVDTTELRETGKRLTREGTEYQEAIETLDNAIRALQPGWEGDAAQAHAGRHAAWLQDALASAEELRAAGKRAAEAADTVDAVENAVTSLWS